MSHSMREPVMSYPGPPAWVRRSGRDAERSGRRAATFVRRVAPVVPGQRHDALSARSDGIEDFLPGAYAQFLRVAGTEFGDPVTDTEVCQGVIEDVVRRLDDKLIAHNRTSVDFLSGPVEIRDSTYPLDAVQQLVRNAVMHRTYEDTNAPTHVYWFDDRIEIGSPGGAYGAVNAGNFGQPGVVDYRNPILAEAMRVLGLVQRYGFGIPAARRLLRAAGHPEPEFRVDPSWVHCTVRART